MVKKSNAIVPRRAQITSYFPKLPITKTGEYVVRERHVIFRDVPKGSHVVPHKGKLPKPAQRNIHSETCALHQVLGWEPEYMYSIEDMSAKHTAILCDILLMKATIEYRKKLLYCFTMFLIDNNKQGSFCYAKQEICLRSECSDNLVLYYNLCLKCMRHTVYDLGIFKFT